MNKNKKSFLTIAIPAFLIATCVSASSMFAGTEKMDIEATSTNQASSGAENDIEIVVPSSNLVLADDVKAEIQQFNEKLVDYYMSTWNDHRYISYFGLLTSQVTGIEILVSDVCNHFDMEIPESLENAEIFFVKPKTLKPYLGDGILDEDLEILSVFTGVPVEGGIFVSSLYDEGGILDYSSYQQFILGNMPIHGEVTHLTPIHEDYQKIIDMAVAKDQLLDKGNVKHLVSDGKYASIVISSPQNPAYIKQFALMNTDGDWRVVIEGLEALDQIIFTNYAYTDFNLELLPSYDLQYMSFTSNLSEVIANMKNSGVVASNDNATYACASSDFAYFEFESGSKILKHGENIYEVADSIEAIELMFTLNSNPPFVILKF